MCIKCVMWCVILNVCGQLVPLLLRLFPGSSLSDVISSGTAQTVKAQLMERIQTWKLAGFPVSRWETVFFGLHEHIHT